MRAKRIRRSPMSDATIYPTYELMLKPDEELRAMTKTLENIEKGSKLMIKCTMENEHFENIVFKANNKDIGQSSGSSKYLMIDSFETSHSGMYECGAKRTSDNKYHSRQMRVSAKRENKFNLPSCPDDEGYCGDHGACFLDGPRKVCHCDDGYMGETCDKVLMTAYDVKFLKVVGGTTTSLNVVCIVLAILFALLYVKERKSLIRLRRTFEGIHDECGNNTDEIYRETTTNNGVSKDNSTDQQNISFTRSSIRKMRLAFNRARLNGTTDSKLLDK